MSSSKPLQGARSTRLLPVLLDRLTDHNPDNRNEALSEYEIVRQLDLELATKLYYALGGR